MYRESLCSQQKTLTAPIHSWLHNNIAVIRLWKTYMCGWSAKCYTPHRADLFSCPTRHRTMSLWRCHAHYYPLAHANQSGQLIQNTTQTHSSWQGLAVLLGERVIRLDLFSVHDVKLLPLCLCMCVTEQTRIQLCDWTCTRLWELLHRWISVLLSFPASRSSFVTSISACIPGARRARIRCKVSNSRQTLLLPFSDDRSPLPQLPGSQFVFVAFAAAAARFDLRLKKTELGDYQQKHARLHDLAWVCACTRSHRIS